MKNIWCSEDIDFLFGPAFGLEKTPPIIETDPFIANTFKMLQRIYRFAVSLVGGPDDGTVAYKEYEALSNGYDGFHPWFRAQNKNENLLTSFLNVRQELAGLIQARIQTMRTTGLNADVNNDGFMNAFIHDNDIRDVYAEITGLYFAPGRVPTR